MFPSDTILSHLFYSSQVIITLLCRLLCLHFPSPGMFWSPTASLPLCVPHRCLFCDVILRHFLYVPDPRSLPSTDNSLHWFLGRSFPKIFIPDLFWPPNSTNSLKAFIDKHLTFFNMIFDFRQVSVQQSKTDLTLTTVMNICNCPTLLCRETSMSFAQC